MFRRVYIGLFTIFLAINVYAIDIHVDISDDQSLSKQAQFSDLVKAIQSNLKSVKAPSQERLKHIASSLVKMAESLGYYDAKIHIRKDKDIYLTLKVGTQYRIAKVNYKFLRGANFPWKEKRIVRENKPLIAEEILNEVQQITELLERDNCFYRVNVDYDVKLNRRKKEAYVTFTQQESVSASFGETHYIGLNKIPEKLVTRQLLWKPGQCYKRSIVDKTINQLLVGQLFSEVAVKEQTPTNANPNVSMTVIVKEGLHRTVSASLAASTFNPFGIGLGFEHRNFTGHTDKFSIDTLMSIKEQSVNFRHYYPWLDNQDQNLTTELLQHHEITQAYIARGSEFQSTMDRKFNHGFIAKAGIGYQNKKVKDPFTEQWYQLGNFLFVLTQTQAREKYPNNWQQFSWEISIKPFLDLNENNNRFYQTIINTKWMYPLGRRWNLSQRIKYGVLDGESLTHVPPHLRYYSGGKDSIRGYNYKEIGTLYDRSRDGGERVFEFSHELSYFFKPNWALRGFADAGNIYPKPDKAASLYWGAGAGIGYVIGHAMVNFDVAVPLTERDKIDKPFQFYLTLVEVG